MNVRPDPEETRETQTPPPPPPPRPRPPEAPTRFIPVEPRHQASPPPPAPRQPHLPARPRPLPRPAPRFRPPTGQPPLRQPAPPVPGPAPATRRSDRLPGESTSNPPWWQTINRDRAEGPLAALPKPKPEPVKPAAQPVPPAQTSQPPAPAASERRSPVWWRVTAAAGAAVVIGGVAAGVSLSESSRTPRVLDIAAAERQVELIVREPLEGYGAATVTAVSCNNGVNPTIQKGATFSCDAVVDGTPRQIAVVFQDDAGTFAVDRPR